MLRLSAGLCVCGGDGDTESSRLRLKFSGVASSGAESTSRSDSGELGGPVRDGDDGEERCSEEAG